MAGGDEENSKYNLKNSAVKRILQEVKEMQSNPSHDYTSLPLEENIFEWQFAIRGPRDSEFEGGIYHGRIQLPADYPFQPPSFMMLTPNGRFETQTKICLSISNHHPEHWQPSWSVRTALVALIAFMPTKPDGALGSLDYTKDERHALAIKSREAPPKFGGLDRQKLIDEIHEYMLSKVPPGPPIPPSAESTKEQQQGGAPEGPSQPDNGPEPSTILDELNGDPEAADEGRIIENVQEVQMNANAGPIHLSVSARLTRRVPAAAAVGETSQNQVTHRSRVERSVDDRWLTGLAIALTIAIIVLVIKKYRRAFGLSENPDEL